eukprot:gene12060-16141_t
MIGHGLLPFTYIFPLIPNNAKYIYVLTESKARFKHYHSYDKCTEVLSWLFDELKTRFPTSTVVILRGNDLYLDMARFTLSNVTICSSSSFCFYPALANNASALYLPVSPLFPSPESVNLNSFHWIHHKGLIEDGWPQFSAELKYKLLEKTLDVSAYEGYAIKGGNVFEAMGMQWNEVVSVTDHFLFSIPDGEPVQAAITK